MTLLRHAAPRPRSSSRNPAYPRFVGAGLVAIAAIACGGSVEGHAQAEREGTGASGPLAGGMPPPFETGGSPAGGTAGTGGTIPSPGTGGSPYQPVAGAAGSAEVAGAGGVTPNSPIAGNAGEPARGGAAGETSTPEPPLAGGAATPFEG